MIIHVDPDETVVEYVQCTCGASNRNTTCGYPAICVCGGAFKSRKATPEEYRENRRRRLTEQAEKLRGELAAIESELGRS